MKPTNSGLGLLLVMIMILPGLGWALPWDKDMRNQPSVKPQETQVYTNKSSVPTHGKELIPAPKDISEMVQGRLQAGTLKNPVANTEKSLNRGKYQYDIHCAVCHGMQGQGDGPVGKKYVPTPMNLTLDYVQLQPDGQLFYTISHGSIAMPYYWDSMPAVDRWHVINYIKSVLGRNPENE